MKIHQQRKYVDSCLLWLQELDEISKSKKADKCHHGRKNGWYWCDPMVQNFLACDVGLAPYCIAQTPEENVFICRNLRIRYHLIQIFYQSLNGANSASRGPREEVKNARKLAGKTNKK